ncbi:MAG: penicillin-binding protein 2 [Caedimonas sp.]|nr:penicillin-binding protein 2 [Caedimonas sp.]
MKRRTSLVYPQDSRTLFTRRAFVISGVKAMLTSLLVARLGYLGVIRSSHYRTLADGNRIKLQILLPKRGIIMDREGLELAANNTNYRLTLVPDQVEDLEDILTKIDALIQLAPKSLASIKAEIPKQAKFKPFILKNHLDWDEVCKMQVHRPELEGIDVEIGHKRYYPFSLSFAHLVGFVQTPSERDGIPDELANLPDYRIGRTGLEKQFELHLQGKAGYREIEVNAHRRIVRDLNKVESKDGATLRLSLDTRLQEAAFKRLSEVQSGAAVVINVKTGEILSCISTPSFDPNLFVNGISHEDWDALNNSPYTPLNNKAVQGVYPPGSIFKLVVALAALETGKFLCSHESFCKGFIELGSHRFHCVRQAGHGRVDMVRALQMSCDTYFYELGRLIGIDRIADMAFKLGLGRETGIELSIEKSGLVPTRSWKKTRFHQSWTVGDTIISSIGQGSMLCTPLQMAMLIARLVTGKKVVPTLLHQADSFSVDFAALPVKPENLEILKKGMDAGVNQPGGTAYFSRIEDPTKAMGGKTATSQVRRISKLERDTRVLKNEEIEWKRRDHSIFAGYAPTHDPQYAICVLVEHGGGGGRIATPIARDILREVQREKKI